MPALVLLANDVPDMLRKMEVEKGLEELEEDDGLRTPAVAMALTELLMGLELGGAEGLDRNGSAALSASVLRLVGGSGTVADSVKGLGN